MAKVKAAELVDHLGYQFKQALADALLKVAPDVQVDSQELFKEFKRAVGRRCRPWENVPSNCVED
jgi:hypothetical protein